MTAMQKLHVVIDGYFLKTTDQAFITEYHDLSVHNIKTITAILTLRRNEKPKSDNDMIECKLEGRGVRGCIAAMRS